MRKEIKAWGNSAGLILTKADLEVYDLAIGDVIELTVTVIKEKKKKRN
jgi:antitoxin component of MazEF toxin-antitoxin module